MSRPESKDIFAPKPGIFSWLRDQAYDFVYYEIGAGLDFVGDMFRGPSGYSKSLHRQSNKAQARTPKTKPLTQSEQAVFLGMLKRGTSEPQMAYWKRKKALLNNPDKKELVDQQRALDTALTKRQAKHPNINIEASPHFRSPTRTQGQKQSKARSR